MSLYNLIYDLERFGDATASGGGTFVWNQKFALRAGHMRKGLLRRLRSGHIAPCWTSNFGQGWNNPEHAKLPGYVNNISGLPQRSRRIIRRALRRLRQRREDSDYRPGITIDRIAAKESIRDLAEVFRVLDWSE